VATHELAVVVANEVVVEEVCLDVLVGLVIVVRREVRVCGGGRGADVSVGVCVTGQLDDSILYAVPQPMWQPDPQGKLTVTVGMAVGQSHGLDTVLSLMHIGTAHEGQMVPVLVMVGQWVLTVGVGAGAVVITSPAGAAATRLEGYDVSHLLLIRWK
jgi:hypothetical protein